MKLSSRPPRPVEPDPAELEAFLTGRASAAAGAPAAGQAAGDGTGGAKEKTARDPDADLIGRPWLDPRLRDDVLKVYNLRLPERYLLKLKFIAENSPQSMQRFCLDTLLPAIDERVRELDPDGPDPAGPAPS